MYIYICMQTCTLGRPECLLIGIPDGTEQDAPSEFTSFWLCAYWAPGIPTQSLLSCTVEKSYTSSSSWSPQPGCQVFYAPAETWAALTPLPCWLQLWLLPWPWWLWGGTGEVQGDNSCGLRAHSSQAHQVSAHVCKGPSEHMLIRSAPGVARSTPGAGGPH